MFIPCHDQLFQFTEKEVVLIKTLLVANVTQFKLA